jgi:hypothetical protein
MIIVKLTGGIGNQMFQYAAARRLSFVNDTQLRLDLSWFDEVGPSLNRKYELEVFNIASEIANSADIAALKPKKLNSFWSRLPNFLKNINQHNNRTHLIEKNFSFDSAILSLRGNVYIEGYWQSEKYFIDIGQIIRREFSFKKDVPESNQRTLDNITSSESIAVHIRRGDYVTLPTANAYHGLCQLNYYHLAANIIGNQLSKPVFYVFSDDITWAKHNLKLDYEINFIDHNGPDRGCEDLRLMSLCKHHVIANSSFSWWGAWLDPGRNKIVCAPRRWFCDESINTSDLIPDSWIRL